MNYKMYVFALVILTSFGLFAQETDQNQTDGPKRKVNTQIENKEYTLTKSFILKIKSDVLDDEQEFAVTSRHTYGTEVAVSPTLNKTVYSDESVNVSLNSKTKTLKITAPSLLELDDDIPSAGDKKNREKKKIRLLNGSITEDLEIEVKKRNENEVLIIKIPKNSTISAKTSSLLKNSFKKDAGDELIGLEDIVITLADEL